MQFETAAGFLVRSGDWDQKEGCLEGEVEEVEQRSFNIITPTPVAESTGINDIAKDIEIPLIASHAVDEHDAVKSAKIDGSAGGVGIQKLCAEIVPSNVKEELEEEKGQEELAEQFLGSRQMKTVLGGVIKENENKRISKSQSKEISQDMVEDKVKSDQRSFNIITPTPEAETTSISIVVNDVAKDIKTPLIASIAVDEDAVKSDKIDGSAGAVGIQKVCDEIIPSNVREEFEEEKEREEIAEQYLGPRQLETVLGGVISKSKEISQDTIEDEVKSEGISTGINIVVNETPLLVSIAAAEDDAVKSAKIDGSAGAEGIQKLCDESIPSNAREELEEEKEREEIAEHLGLRQMKTVLGGVIKENKKKRMRRSQSKEISQDMVADETKSDPETPPNMNRNYGKIKGWTAGPSAAQIAPPRSMDQWING